MKNWLKGYSLPRVQITTGDSHAIDAFGRFRVSNPVTLFDSKNIYDDPDIVNTLENQPLFYDNQELTGGGTSTAYNTNQASQSISVSASTAGWRTRQTKMRFNYQPGKSHLVLMTFKFSTSSDTGLIFREGLFDGNNGLFFSIKSGVACFVRRTYTSGSAVDNEYNQSEWNVDRLDGSGGCYNPSGLNLDFTKAQILAFDMEWLGVGRIRFGFVVDGIFHVAHEVRSYNAYSFPHISTPNLPLRSEIINLGTGGAGTLTQICSTVISEGASADLGKNSYASTNGTHVDCANENTIYAIIGMRLKSAYIGASIDMIEANIQLQTGSHRCEWMMILNPVVTGTFTYVNEANSSVQIARASGAGPTVTGGFKMAGGFVESGGVQSGSAGSISSQVPNALRLGSLIDGTTDTLVLCARPIGGSSGVDVEGSLFWKELL